MTDEKKEDCVICEIIGQDTPVEMKVSLAFGLGSLTHKAPNPPPFCLSHETLNASVAAMFGVMQAREAKAGPTGSKADG